MRTLTGAVLSIAFLLNFQPARADVPMLLNYQGSLSASDGTPLSGTFTVGFAIYDALTGGNDLPSGTPWAETQNVTVTDGVFNVLLGSVTPLPGEEIFEGGPADGAGPLRYLAVTVCGPTGTATCPDDTETLSPRRRIVSAAYAIHPNATASARVTLSGTTPVGGGGGQVVLGYDTERWDTADLHDNVVNNSRLTAPTTGTYLICGHVLWPPNSNGRRILSIRVSPGITIVTGDGVPPSSSFGQSVCTAWRLAAGEYAELIVEQDSGTTLSIGSGGDQDGFTMTRID